jgi:hypothetical protein
MHAKRIRHDRSIVWLNARQRTTSSVEREGVAGHLVKCLGMMGLNREGDQEGRRKGTPGRRQRRERQDITWNILVRRIHESRSRYERRVRSA